MLVDRALISINPARSKASFGPGAWSRLARQDGRGAAANDAFGGAATKQLVPHFIAAWHMGLGAAARRTRRGSVGAAFPDRAGSGDPVCGPGRTPRRLTRPSLQWRKNTIVSNTNNGSKMAQDQAM